MRVCVRECERECVRVAQSGRQVFHPRLRPQAPRVILQGYFAHPQPPPPSTLLNGYAQGPRGVLEGQGLSYGRDTPVDLFQARPSSKSSSTSTSGV